MGEIRVVLMGNRCELGETRGGGDVQHQLAITIDGDPGARMVPDRAPRALDKLAGYTDLAEEPALGTSSSRDALVSHPLRTCAG